MSHTLPIVSIRSVVFTVFVTLFAFVLGGCGSGAKISPPINYQGDGTSGVRGIVTGYGNAITPTSIPIVHATVSAHTRSVVAGNPLIGVQVSPGPLVAQTQTDALGNYTLVLIPGSYFIEASSNASTIPQGSSNTIAGGMAAVTTQQFVQIDIAINYGGSLKSLSQSNLF